MENEWKTIKTKNKNKNNKIKVNKKNKINSYNLFNESSLKEYKEEDIQQFIIKLENIQLYLKQTIFYEQLRILFERYINKNIEKIVFLGIGHFLTSNSSLLQLALGRELFGSIQNNDNNDNNSNNIYIYDPLLTETEIRICHLLRLNVDSTSVNIHCASGFTVFYMPHCPYTLYNQVIWSNWGNNLNNIVILGNSFESYLLRLDGGNSTYRSNCIKILQNVITEITAWRSEYRSDDVVKRSVNCNELHFLENAFIDLSLMDFTKDSNDREELLRVETRPSEEDMNWDMENDLELILTQS